ncbi:MAG: hypothetical protein MK212_17680 [Saprospiraceae bacterium]|nr:hypothetical protein [Saprospiraceae bacterium]
MRIFLILLFLCGIYLNADAQSKVVKTVIEFKANSAELQANEIAKLIELAPILVRSKIYLHAYLDEVTEASATDSLSYLRANNVKMILLGGGIPSKQIQIYYYDQPTVLSEEDIHNRRVVLEARVEEDTTAIEPKIDSITKDTTAEINPEPEPERDPNVAAYQDQIRKFWVDKLLLIDLGANVKYKGVEDVAYTRLWKYIYQLKKLKRLTTESTEGQLLQTLGIFELPKEMCRFRELTKLSLVLDDYMNIDKESIRLYKKQKSNDYTSKWAEQELKPFLEQIDTFSMVSVEAKGFCGVFQLALPITTHFDTIALTTLDARAIDFHCFKQRIGFRNSAAISTLDSTDAYNHYVFNSPNEAEQPYFLDFQCLGLSGDKIQLSKLDVEKVAYYDTYRKDYYPIELEEIKVKVLGMEAEKIYFEQPSINLSFKTEVHNGEASATLFRKLSQETKIYVKLVKKLKKKRKRYLLLRTLEYDEKNRVYIVKAKDLFLEE